MSLLYQIEMELVRRTEEAKEAKRGAFFGKSGKDLSLESSASFEASASGPIKNRDQDDFEKEAVDFFGRAIAQPKNDGSGSLDGSLTVGLGYGGAGGSKKKTRIWYKFNEGFSNAVKAKVFISELL
ncbi:hypothetical protein BC939DRAFT_447418 [Gamsiella multidivaricata]|uniref:uncharacterized protein n=1 Tax=Gamsiella multidivaricata TaxID=101098 RepID=UPI00222117F2|nr:uncharacterized protein BC939DRAFT_447418 [Gamsiella multidivaricata]KAI7825989.1 hypothetical protein BC939DRAFT_447418 [Gamsiella multidivaricata]